MYEETVYYVACPRKDGKQPKLVKACDDVFFLDRKLAENLLIVIEHELGVKHEIHKAKVSI